MIKRPIRRQAEALLKNASELRVDDMMRRVQRGDQAAFASLYDLLSPMAYGVCVGVLGDLSRAQEATEETFVQIWHLAPNFEFGQQSVDRWASSLAHRCAVASVRANRQLIGEKVTDLDGAKGSPATDSTPQGQSSEPAGNGARAVSKLSAAQGQAINLAYFGGLTWQQLAEVLRIPTQTVVIEVREGLSRAGRLLVAESKQ